MQQQPKSGRRQRKSSRVVPPPILPDEIVEGEILTRLPTKSLLRFRSVSNRWRSLISDPIFIQSQHKHVDLKLMLLSPSSSQLYSLDQDQLESLNHDDGSAIAVQAHQFRIPVSAPHGFSVIGSCNGLLCLSINDYICGTHYGDDREYCPDYRGSDLDYAHYHRYTEGCNVGRDAIIWNPLFKSYHKVAGFPYFTEKLPLPLSCPLVGFGCSTDNDGNYKLIKFFPLFKAVQVYTLKTMSLRSFQIEPRGIRGGGEGAYIWDTVGTFLNGSLYWFDVCDRVLVVFDLKSEKFRMSSKVLDDDVYRRVTPIQGTNMIVVRGGCLGLFVTDNDRAMNALQHDYFYLLTMKLAAAADRSTTTDLEDNVISSWSLLKIQHPQGRICKPICTMGGGELLMRIIKNNCTPNKYQMLLSSCSTSDSKQFNGRSSPNLETDLDISAKDGMIIYNHQDGTVKNLEVHGAGELDCSQFILYMQTFCEF